MYYKCPDCQRLVKIRNINEMLKLSVRLGIVLCLNGCGIMIPVREKPEKVEQLT